MNLEDALNPGNRKFAGMGGRGGMGWCLKHLNNSPDENETGIIPFSRKKDSQLPTAPLKS